ncbi:hypothetical protein BDY21DRAFT_330005 [Lineolata rhizophorae]|uniref:Uncharacterized protein n=1 Tax=Lineolata rhizophorae TaxID=578093 RepID=A0A6A6PEU6_9PEZI|nr:hypothetical protein BDY21DRAFT_330005 [Lineolata rhizophorae]
MYNAWWRDTHRAQASRPVPGEVRSRHPSSRKRAPRRWGCATTAPDHPFSMSFLAAPALTDRALGQGRLRQEPIAGRRLLGKCKARLVESTTRCGRLLPAPRKGSRRRAVGEFRNLYHHHRRLGGILSVTFRRARAFLFGSEGLGAAGWLRVFLADGPGRVRFVRFRAFRRPAMPSKQDERWKAPCP